MEINRKLASIRRINNLSPIEGADLIEVATVDGWKVVVKRGEFLVGDLVVYFEIDSFIPHIYASFLSKGKEPSQYNDVKGERIRTIKLRGQISQGLILPVDSIDSISFVSGWMHDDGVGTYLAVHEGDDVTEVFGVQKWEPVLSANLQGKAKGNFPTNIIPKTDQERVQNCFMEIQKKSKRLKTEKFWNEQLQIVEERSTTIPPNFKEPTYEVTMKLDGSSMTLFKLNGELRVCSRNLELDINEDNKDNAYVKMALSLADKLPEGLAFQGELMGSGIQGNRDQLKEHKFYLFDVYDIIGGKYLTPLARRTECSLRDFDHVPVLDVSVIAPNSVVEALKFAEGASINHKIREGVVWKCNEDPTFSFKAINNTFLLGEK